MTDLDTLRSEVREALATVDFYFNDGAKGTGWPEVRAELLRLVGENAQLRDVLADRDMDREMAAHANKELAALKAKIAGSRHAFLGPNMDRITVLAEDIGPIGEYAIVKVED